MALNEIVDRLATAYPQELLRLPHLEQRPKLALPECTGGGDQRCSLAEPRRVAEFRLIAREAKFAERGFERSCGRIQRGAHEASIRQERQVPEASQGHGLNQKTQCGNMNSSLLNRMGKVALQRRCYGVRGV